MTTGYTLCGDCRAWGTAAVRPCDKHAASRTLIALLAEGVRDHELRHGAPSDACGGCWGCRAAALIGSLS